jgi:hypothetical protein
MFLHNQNTHIFNGRSEDRIPVNFKFPSKPALGPTQFPVQWVSGFFPWRKAYTGLALTTIPYLAPKLKKDWRYTSTQF